MYQGIFDGHNLGKVLLASSGYGLRTLAWPPTMHRRPPTKNRLVPMSIVLRLGDPDPEVVSSGFR